MSNGWNALCNMSFIILRGGHSMIHGGTVKLANTPKRLQTNCSKWTFGGELLKSIHLGESAARHPKLLSANCFVFMTVYLLGIN